MCSPNHFSISSRFPCFSIVQVFQGPGFSWQRFSKVQVFQSPGFSGSRFSRVQVFEVWAQGPVSGSRVQSPGPGFRVLVQLIEVTIKKETLAQVFSSREFYEISKNTFSHRTLRWLLLNNTKFNQFMFHLFANYKYDFPELLFQVVFCTF